MVLFGRFKLTTLGPVFVGFLVMLALGAALLASTRTGNEIIERSVIDSGQTIISTSSKSLFNSLYTLDIDSINIALQQFIGENNIIYAAVRDGSGQPVARAADGWAPEERVSQNLSVEALRQRESVHRNIGRYLVMSGPIAAGSDQIGTLEIVFDKTSLQASLESQQRDLLIVIIGLLIGTVVILAMFIRYATKPLGTLTAVASEIGAGNLDAPVPVSGSKEMVVFANALEHMRANLKRLYSGLEQRVAERTQELSAANEDLKNEIVERGRAERATQQISHRNELILNSAGEGIFGLDLRGRTTFVNPAAARTTGWEVEELIGQPRHTIAHHSKPNGSPYPPEECPILAALKDGEVHRVTDEVFWRKDGTNFPVEYMSTPILEQGKLVGAVVTFRDITERLAVDRMKDEFISVVSHELRTPLTSIRGSLGLIAGGVLGTLPDKAQNMAEIAVSNTDRLIRLINDILDIERMESGTITMERTACDAAVLMAQAADLTRGMAEEAGVTLSVSPESVQIWADPDRIVQTFTNLLSNAIKFSPRGGSVKLVAQRQGNRVLFEVNDQGRGIPVENLESIFERFQQVDASDSREKGGTGLGLAICRSIAQQHEGRIWAESTAGEGSTFFFALPVLQKDLLERIIPNGGDETKHGS